MITVETIPRYTEVYRKLRGAGLSASLMKRVILPVWWEKEDEKSEAACQSAYLEIAAKLGVTYSELIDVTRPLDFNASVNKVAFKTGHRDTSELSASAHLGLRLAHVIATAYSQSECYTPFNRMSVDECRSAILRGVSWVSFSPLLDFCWRSGIPVVYWKGEAGQKFDGISTSIDGIPVIVLGSAKNTAWSAFHLAHELGHIMLGHTDDSQLNVDPLIENAPEEKNEREKDASTFARMLLQGTEELPLVKMSISPEALRKYAVKYRVSPSTILLNSCWSLKNDKDYMILNRRISNMQSVYETRRVVNELLLSKIGHDFDMVLSDWQHDFLETLLG